MRVLGAICLCTLSIYADTIPTLPSLITLTPNTHKQDSTLAQAGNGEQTFFHARSLSIIGADNATYTLSASDKTTHFQSAGIQLTSKANVALMGYHTLSFGDGSTLMLDSGTSLQAILSDKSLINPQASEYGGESKVRFGEHSKLLLAQNSRASFTQLRLFIHDGSVVVENGATLSIEADKAIRFQSSMHNNGGTLTLKGDVYNVGNTRGFVPNDYTTIAQFVSRNGTITIDGDFYNGGQTNNAIDSSGGGSGLNSFDPAFGGGGELALYGGRMVVSGRLISQQGGDLVVGGDLRNPKDSSIKLYGGVLEVRQGVQNKQASTITFGAHNGKLGQIIGNLSNEGTILVDSKGLSLGTHTFIQGTLTNSGTLSLTQTKHDFITITLIDSSTGIKLERKDDAINAFHTSLGTSAPILHALDSMLTQADMGSIYTYGGQAELGALVQDTKDTLAAEQAAPLAALESLQTQHLIATPLSPQTLAKLGILSNLSHLAYNSAPYSPYPPRYKARLPRSYAPYQRSPLAAPSYIYAPQRRVALDMRALGGGVFGKYGAGGLAGVDAGASTQILGHNLRLGVGFAYSSLGQNLANTSTKSSNYGFNLCLSDTISLGGLELDMGILWGLGSFETQSLITLSSNALDSRASFWANRLMGEVALGWRFFMGRVFFKPYASVRQYLFTQHSPSAQSGAIAPQGYTNYMINIGFGAQSGVAFLAFKGVGILTARADYEPMLYSSKQEATISLGSTPISIALPYNDRFSLGVNAHYQLRRSTMGLELFYTRIFSGMHTLGASAIAAYRF